MDKVPTKSIAAIVPAAGYGARAARNGEQNGNKILTPLCGRPLLGWTLQALCEAGLRIGLFQIQVAARREEFSLIEPMLRDLTLPVVLVEGGVTRQQSVWNAAREANLQAEFFLVHDAARPLVSSILLARVCEAASTHGAAMAAIPVSDTVKITREFNGVRCVESTPDRKNVYLAQTPQVFRRDIFLQAFERAHRENFEGTDCASLIERNDGSVAIVEGDIENFKVTYPADLDRAETALRLRGRVN